MFDREVPCPVKMLAAKQDEEAGVRMNMPGLLWLGTVSGQRQGQSIAFPLENGRSEEPTRR